MNVCIIDDNKFIADGIKKTIINVSKELEETINCYVFYNTKDFNRWFSVNSVDICFLDVNLNNKANDAEGLQLAKRLKQIDYHTLIIFISGFNDYYVDMVQVEPFRFLHKPFEHKDVTSVFKLAYDRYFLQTHENAEYRYKYNGIIFSVDLKDVKYIYSLKRKICMKTNNDVLEFYGKLDNVENEILNLSKDFLRIGKSYLVNTKYVTSFNKCSIQIDNEEFNISEKYKNVVVNSLEGKIIT